MEVCAAKKNVADDSEGEAMPFCWYGCFFCRTGQEVKLAQAAESRWPGMKACAVSALKRRSSEGVKTLNSEVMLPGYIFFETTEDCAPTAPFPEGILRLLTNLDGGFALSGQDEWFAKWVIGQNGEIGMSKAHRVGDHIQIQKGPLKDMEGYILRIDRRNRNGLVRLEVNGREIKAWLPFEIVENDVFDVNGCE